MRKFFIRLWFKYQLNKGKLINVDDRHRFVGKTTMLVNHSVKNNIPIIVGNQQNFEYIKHININTEIYRLAKNFTLDMRGKEFPNGVLIEESVAFEMLAWLKKEEINVVGGFISKEKSK